MAANALPLAQAAPGSAAAAVLDAVVDELVRSDMELLQSLSTGVCQRHFCTRFAL